MNNTKEMETEADMVAADEAIVEITNGQSLLLKKNTISLMTNHYF